jgi:hypothetical protein
MVSALIESVKTKLQNNLCIATRSGADDFNFELRTGHTLLLQHACTFRRE